MAQFYADIQGNRGEATRMGTPKSGIQGHIRGWNIGARIVMRHENGRDVCRVYQTSGSSGAASDKLVAEFSDDES